MVRRFVWRQIHVTNFEKTEDAGCTMHEHGEGEARGARRAIMVENFSRDSEFLLGGKFHVEYYKEHINSLLGSLLLLTAELSTSIKFTVTEHCQSQRSLNSLSYFQAFTT